jgi:uncharacterized phage protein (TIGR02218 family)
VKTQSVGLSAHRDLGTTTLAWCWKVTRTDGEVFGFTSIDRPLEIDGVTYEAATGVTPSAIQSRADLAVPNLELAGALDSDTITEADLVAGVWDNAVVEIFEVNYADLTQGAMLLSLGSIGNVSATRSAYSAEQRGLAQALQQPVGFVTTPHCLNQLGDARCQFDVEVTRLAGTVSAVTGTKGFTADDVADADADYFGGGEVTWTSGDNAGLRIEVLTHAAGGIFDLVLPMPRAIQEGDTFTVIAGCRKRRTEDCFEKFANVVNFLGFPDLPGNSRVIGNAGLDTTE